MGDIVDSGKGCRTVLPVYVALRARTLCRSQLYPSVRDLKFILRVLNLKKVTFENYFSFEKIPLT
jgi:hypothetical protein